MRRVPFDVLSIGRYEALELSTVGSDIWIQSFEAKQRDIWYQLGQPSPEYRRYQEPFLWIANFAKHVVDYLYLHPVVYLNDFRSHFSGWLSSAHRHDEGVARWLKDFDHTDFRGALVAHANFLYCQAAQVDSRHTKQPLWAEIDSRAMSAVPEQVEKGLKHDMIARIETGGQSVGQRKTTVTPYVKSCFARMPWAKSLYSSMLTMLKNPAEKAKTNLYPKGSRCGDRAAIMSRSDLKALKRKPLQLPVKTGDVVAIERDKGSQWKTEDHEYYAYIQGITVTSAGRSLSLLWFYRLGDTACMKMLYPFENELFLSDHCNCGDAAVYEHNVIHLPRVTFFGHPESPNCDFFCRQQYMEGDVAWRTLQRSHFRCQCKKPSTKLAFKIGDTLLVKKRSGEGQQTLEPTILVEHVQLDSGEYVKVRRLLRKSRDYGCSNAAPNELVFTNQFDILPVSNIERRCQIHCFTEDEKEQWQIPHPYNKRGMGDFFFIIAEERPKNLESLISERNLEPLPLSEPWSMPFRQGWLPERSEADRCRLRGLDIFCGGGSFGRGLEEGGAVDFEWAVDCCNEAIHTYKANVQEGKKTKLFRGSVNHYLSQAMARKEVGLVAQKGEVDMIISGNPCQGFSIMNPHRGLHDRRLVNESLVASAISFIDFYRPKYAILENVLGIASGGSRNNVLAQVLCALVGMGYQVKAFILDAWNFSSPQSRSRVFISCAVAGLEPLEEPPHTHSHPEQVIGSSLGKTANGLRISARSETPTPFEYVTAEEALKDLPVTDGRTSCIPFPDHRMSVSLSTLDRIRLESVPCHPPGMSFVKAVERGYMPEPQIKDFGWHNSIRAKKGSKCWRRIQRNALMPTVTTVPRPSDGAAGNCLHWDQHRVLTVIEVRRAQGFPDEDAIVGEKRAQYKIVGNSVARPVAFALGISLRKAWLANLKQTATQTPDLPVTKTSLERERVEANRYGCEVSGSGVERQQMEKPSWEGLRTGRVEADTLTSTFHEEQPLKTTKPDTTIQEPTKTFLTNSQDILYAPGALTSSTDMENSKPKFKLNQTAKDDVKSHTYVPNTIYNSSSASNSRVQAPVYFQPRNETRFRLGNLTTKSSSKKDAGTNPLFPTVPAASSTSMSAIMERHKKYNTTFSNRQARNSDSPKNNSPLSTHSGRHNSWAMQSPK